MPHIVGTTTCTRKGYARNGPVRGPVRGDAGYDNAGTHSGAWTNQFLTEGLNAGPNDNIDLARLFEQTHGLYVKTYPQRGDAPCFFARTDGVSRGRIRGARPLSTSPCNTDDAPTRPSAAGPGRWGAAPADAIPKNTYMSSEWLR